MLHKVNPEQIAKGFEDFEIREAAGSRVKTSEFIVEVYNGDTSLFKFEDSTSVLEITSPPNLRDDVIEAIDRSGFYNLEVEFMPAVQDTIKSSNNIIQTKNVLTPTQKNSHDIDFQNWFKSVWSSLAYKVYLIPDTNFLRRCYYSNYIRKISSTDQKHASMRIPRLAIIEVENKFNNNKPTKPQINLNSNEKEKYNAKESEMAKERRIAFQTMSEILSIKHNGGDILRHLDLSLLQSFTPKAGINFADTLIRNEITNNLDHLREDIIVYKDTHETTSEVFLTCDLMNALAAVAENIHTLYFYRIEDDGYKLKPTYDMLALLIVNTTIQLNDCTCILYSPQKTIKKEYYASWSGKSGLEWENNSVLERILE